MEETIKFADPPTEKMRLFELEGTIEECMEHIEAHRLLEAMKREKDVPKIEVPIVVDENNEPVFSSFVQNIVITHEIDYTPQENEEGEPISPPQDEINQYKLDLSYVARSWRFLGAQFNPQRFYSVIRRCAAREAATLYFNSGKLVETGCSRPELALDQLHHEQKMLRAILPWELYLRWPQLQNVVSSGVFAKPICVNYMAVMHSDICSKVGRFPGTMIKDPRQFGECAILIFPTGKFCHSGGRNLMQIYDHLKKVYPLLVECQATPELIPIDERCRHRLAKTTSADQYLRERESLLRSIKRQQSKKKQPSHESDPTLDSHSNPKSETAHNISQASTIPTSEKKRKHEDEDSVESVKKKAKLSE